MIKERYHSSVKHRREKQLPKISYELQTLIFPYSYGDRDITIANDDDENNVYCGIACNNLNSLSMEISCVQTSSEFRKTHLK